jgi:hypothetical protein
MYKNYYIYYKFKSKLFKLINFEIPSPNYDAPSSPISLLLINLKINIVYNYLLKKQ